MSERTQPDKGRSNHNPEIEGSDVYFRLGQIAADFESECGEDEERIASDPRIQTLLDAQDEISYLREEVQSFRAALKQFAKDWSEDA